VLITNIKYFSWRNCGLIQSQERIRMLILYSTFLKKCRSISEVSIRMLSIFFHGYIFCFMTYIFSVPSVVFWSFWYDISPIFEKQMSMVIWPFLCCSKCTCRVEILCQYSESDNWVIFDWHQFFFINSWRAKPIF
jgi:hypothetical protein